MACPLTGVRATALSQSLPTAYTHDPAPVFARERSEAPVAAPAAAGTRPPDLGIAGLRVAALGQRPCQAGARDGEGLIACAWRPVTGDERDDEIVRRGGGEAGARHR